MTGFLLPLLAYVAGRLSSTSVDVELAPELAPVLRVEPDVELNVGEGASPQLNVGEGATVVGALLLAGAGYLAWRYLVKR